MIVSMFSGIAGLRAHQNKMNVIGNNIANVNTVGYKSGRVTFQESIYQTINSSAQGGEVYGGSNPSQVGYGSQVASIDINFNTGSYEPTGLGTDCMIAGTGFFFVGPKNTSINNGGEESQLGQLNLTRVGRFVPDGDGFLTDANGNVLYGFVPDGWDTITGDGITPPSGDTPLGEDTGQLRPLRIPNSIEINGNQVEFTSISIGADGTVQATGSDNEIYKFGKVALAKVPNPNALENQGNGLYKVVNNTGEVEGFRPGEGATGMLMSNGLEMANVDLATEFANMITTQRGFQANSKIITVSDEMLQELISMKR